MLSFQHCFQCSEREGNGAEAERSFGGGGPDKDLSGGRDPRHTSTVTGNKNEGKSDGAAVHYK